MISLADLQRRIEAGELSPDDAIAQSHAAIEAREKDVHAFVRHDKSAKAQASGPLRGIAVGIKDIIDTANMPTEMGSEIYRGWQPRSDAPVVMMLKRAGATIIGKTTTTAFASRDPTPTLNPHNLGHTPGGSSSGSAAAVAAGMLPIATGTQTGGSVIRPAAYCGIAGFKPSYKLLPTIGMKCFSWSLDTVGLFAAGVADVAFATAAISGRDLRVDRATPSAPRIAFARTHIFAEASPDMQNAVEQAAQTLAKAGASVKETALPPILEDAWRAHPVIQWYEAARALAFEYDNRRELIGPFIRDHLAEGASVTHDAYDGARRTVKRARQALADLMSEYDAILTMSAPGAAPHGLGSTGQAIFNRLWTLMGTPCVNVPGLADGTGLPLGVQIVGRFGRDRSALEAALFAERALARSQSRGA